VVRSWVGAPAGARERGARGGSARGCARAPASPPSPAPVLRAFFVNEAPLRAAVALAAREPEPEPEPEPSHPDRQRAKEETDPEAGGRTGGTRACPAAPAPPPPTLPASRSLAPSVCRRWAGGGDPGRRPSHPRWLGRASARRQAPWEPWPAPAAAPCGPGP
jgi:hypothetical protein